MKITKSFIDSVVPHLDHPVLNSLHNASVQPISVPVTLYQGDVAVFSARVEMIGTCLPQYNAALHVTLSAIQDNNIGVEWDGCRFLGGSPLRPRTGVERMMDDPLLAHWDADDGKSLLDIFRAAQDDLMLSCDVVGLNEAVDGYATRIAAALIRETAVLHCDDLTRAISQQSVFTRGRRFIASIFS
jgi:hypothetical protein